MRTWPALTSRRPVPGQLADRYPPGSFGVIFVMDVLEHLPRQRAADFLGQVRRCLRLGGTVIIQTPNMGSIFGVYHRYNDLSHEFGPTEKTARDLMIAGFRNADIEILDVGLRADGRHCVGLLAQWGNGL